jgi:hypothetical protein
MPYELKATSECKTYRETLKCRTQEEAINLMAALQAEGWSVKIRPIPMQEELK